MESNSFFQSSLSLTGIPAGSQTGDSPHSVGSARRLGLVSSKSHASSSLHFRHSPLPVCGGFVGGKLLVRTGGGELAGPLADDSGFPVDDDWLGFGGSDSVIGDRPMDRGSAHSLPVVLHPGARADALCETPAGANDPRQPPTAGGVGDLV